MPFERYVRSWRVYRPQASIWYKGQIGINQGAVKRFKITDFDFAVLFYDKETCRIGVKVTNDENEAGAVKIRKAQSGTMISATAFLDHFDIEHTETRRYPLDYDEGEDLYIIDLNKPITKNEGQ
jgi:hypothetical protein